MATAVGTLTVTDVWSDGKRQHVIGTVAVDASPATYLTGGLALALTDAKIKSQQAPKRIQLNGKSGFLYEYDRANAKMKIRVPVRITGGASAAGTGTVQGKAADAALTKEEAADVLIAGSELVTAVAIPAAVSSDVIDFYGIFDQLR